MLSYAEARKIYRIDWIFLFLPHFPEEKEETQSACCRKKA
jgi:hypothetical protein